MMKDLPRLVIGTVTLFMTFSPFPSFAQVIEPIVQLAVFDDNGKRLGPVVGILGAPPTPGFAFTGGIWFSMKVNDTTVILAQEDQSNLLSGAWKDDIRFESSNCTGTPVFETFDVLRSTLMPSNPVVGGPAPGQAGGGGDNIVYIPDPNGTPRITTISSRPGDGAKNETCRTVIEPDTEVVNAIQLIDIDAVFTRPLHVQEDVAPKKGQGPKKYPPSPNPPRRSCSAQS